MFPHTFHSLIGQKVWWKNKKGTLVKKESEMAALSHVVTDCCSVCSGSRVRPVVQVKVPVRVELTEATLAMKTETTTSTARCKRRRLPVLLWHGHQMCVICCTLCDDWSDWYMCPVISQPFYFLNHLWLMTDAYQGKGEGGQVIVWTER